MAARAAVIGDGRAREAGSRAAVPVLPLTGQGQGTVSVLLVEGMAQKHDTFRPNQPALAWRLRRADRGRGGEGKEGGREEGREGKRENL